jgi:hypothetical protein
MPRRQNNPTVFLALSPMMTATALGLRAEVVYNAIDSGALGPVYVSPTGRRRLLCSSIENWVRSWPKQSKQRKVSHHADA